MYRMGPQGIAIRESRRKGPQAQGTIRLRDLSKYEVLYARLGIQSYM